MSLTHATLAAPARSPAPPTVHQTLRRPGQPLERGTRHAMEARFGHDFSAVRVHTDADAGASAGAVSARAYTVGRDIVFAAGAYRPATLDGQRLLAHELTHVIQQGATPAAGSTARPAQTQLRVGQAGDRHEREADQGAAHAMRVPEGPTSPPALQRQEIPFDLQMSPHYRAMTEQELWERYDRLVEVLNQFTTSTLDTVLLEEQIADIGYEVARRTALAEGRTFRDEDIQRMKDYFVDNAKTERDSCIVALNKGLRTVTGEPALPTTDYSIEATMAKIAVGGHSGTAREIWFKARGGRITRGGARPHELSASVWDAVIDLSGGDVGWSVFTMSLMDGEHSVTLTLDASDPRRPRIYWSDQWQSKGGWKEYTRSTLDAEVTRLVKLWWDDQPVGGKHKTVVRLWRVTATSGKPAGGSP